MAKLLLLVLKIIYIYIGKINNNLFTKLNYFNFITLFDIFLINKLMLILI